MESEAKKGVPFEANDDFIGEGFSSLNTNDTSLSDTDQDSNPDLESDMPETTDSSFRAACFNIRMMHPLHAPNPTHLNVILTRTVKIFDLSLNSSFMLLCLVRVKMYESVCVSRGKFIFVN